MVTILAHHATSTNPDALVEWAVGELEGLDTPRLRLAGLTRPYSRWEAAQEFELALETFPDVAKRTAREFLAETAEVEIDELRSPA